MTTLSLEKITKSYAQTPVLLDVNIDVNSGEFLVLLGPSGCGNLRCCTPLPDCTRSRRAISSSTEDA